MIEATEIFDYKDIIGKNTLNTFTLETGLNHGKPLSDICPKKVNGSEIINIEGLHQLLSLENRKEAWGENYRENNKVITTRLNGNQDEIYLPSIWGGGMGIDISSLSLLEAASLKSSSKIGYYTSSHLSSIGIGDFRGPDLFENNGKGFEKYGNIVEKDFYNLFEIKLGLTRDQIEEQFLKTDENLNLEPENFIIDINKPKKERKTFLDASFQPTNKAGRLFLMKDLTALYNDIKSAKNKGLFVPVNHMYKSTSYVASIKVAALAGADAITTGAGIPRTGFQEKDNTFVQPRNIVLDFYKSIGKVNHKMPTFGLIVSITMAYSPGYDYYIDEDPRNAGGHQGAFESMLPYEKRVGKESVLNSLRKRELIDENIPIYAGGGINSASDIKELFNMGFDGIQLGTNFAVSEEARGGKGKDFKKALISGNHFGAETKIDEIAKKNSKRLRKNIKKEIEQFKIKFEGILGLDKEKVFNLNDAGFIIFKSGKLKKVINAIESQIFKRDNSLYDNLSNSEKNIYGIFSSTLYKKYNGDIEKLREDLKSYGNLLKAFEEFKRFESLDKLPTHLLFDSVVGFIGRLRIDGGEHRLLNDTVMKSILCIQCVTHCLLRNKGGVQSNKGSKFCISDSLRIGDRNPDKSLILNFSGTTTCFYPEIRPIKDIILAYAGVEVIR